MSIRNLTPLRGSKANTILAALAVSLGLTFSQSVAEDKERVHFHGYGEIHSNNDLDKDRVLDVHRAVIGLKAELAANAFFNLELDFEHAFKEPELEFAYVDYVLNQTTTLRMGSMLMPMGPLNEFHEPPLFLSVERSQFNTKLIPTTWNEIGAGLVLTMPEQGLALRAYLVNGLNGKELIKHKEINDRGAKGIRDARYKSKDVRAEDVAGVARLEYSAIPGLSLGGSAYFGGADQSSDENSQLLVGLYAFNAKYQVMGFQVEGQVGYGTIGGSYFDETLNIDARSMVGALGEVAYFIQELAGAGSQLAPFVRYEYINLNMDPAGPGAPDVGEQILTGGLAFLPNPNMAIKLDLEYTASEDGKAFTAMDGTKTVINLGVGIMY